MFRNKETVREDLIETYIAAAQATTTQVAWEAVLAAAQKKLTPEEYSTLLLRLPFLKPWETFRQA